VRVVILSVCLLAGPLWAGDPVPPPRSVSQTDAVVVRRLIDSLDDPDLDVRQNLAIALAKIGPVAVEPLAEALKDKNPERRAGAAYALGLIGPGARSALPALLDLLKDDDVGVRRRASYAVGRIVPGGRPAASVAVAPAIGSGGK